MLRDYKEYILASSIPEPNSGCWLWLKGLNLKGYGQASYKGKNIVASRLSFSEFKGKINELHVLHKCDQRSCVNPEHLFLGTNLDNMHDRDRKGRWANQYTKRKVL